MGAHARLRGLWRSPPLAGQLKLSRRGYAVNALMLFAGLCETHHARCRVERQMMGIASLHPSYDSKKRT
jgi:hypothetical protein